MGVAPGNGNGNGELARQAKADFGPHGGNGLAGGVGGIGRPAPPTVRIRGEFTADQAHWIINYLWDNRGAMWNCFPHLAPNGLYYLELRHFLWPRGGRVVYLHTRAEFMEMLTSHDYDDLPVRAVPPLPAGHRR